MKTLLTAAAAAIFCLSALPAEATSGWGCYRANVGPNDPLNVRAGPTSKSAVVTSFDYVSAPIVALAVSGPPADTLFEAHKNELATCTPSSLPLGARWCPVRVFDASGMKEGYIKRRFVDHSECP